MIPFIDLRHVVDLVRPAAVDAIYDALDRHEFIGAETVQKLEAELCRQLDARYAVACKSGSDALVLALAAYGVSRGDRVAVPDVTFWATYEAPLHLGAEVVLIPIESHNAQMSFSGLLRAHRRRRLRAAVLPHLFGGCTEELWEIRRWCAQEGVTLVEDAAQAFGVQIDQVSVFGATAATLSFHPAKVIGGLGGGGAVLLSDGNAAQRVRRLANHGRSGHYEHDAPGWNSRMSGVEATYLLQMLNYSTEILGQRRLAWQTYEALLAQRGLRLLAPHPTVAGNGYLATMLTRRRGSRAAALLAEKGVGTGRVYPMPLSKQNGLQHGSTAMPDSTEAADDFCMRVVNLPLFYGITREQQEIVVRAVTEVWRDE